MKSRRLFNGQRLQELMDSKGFSVSELAEKVHTNKSNVSRWIDGLRQPRPRKIKVLATLFKVAQESLLLPEGNANGNQN